MAFRWKKNSNNTKIAFLFIYFFFFENCKNRRVTAFVENVEEYVFPAISIRIFKYLMKTSQEPKVILENLNNFFLSK